MSNLKTPNRSLFPFAFEISTLLRNNRIKITSLPLRNRLDKYPIQHYSTFVAFYSAAVLSKDAAVNSFRDVYYCVYSSWCTKRNETKERISYHSYIFALSHPFSFSFPFLKKILRYFTIILCY